MRIFKCKMCGGDLEVSVDMSIATCQYCGTQQTLPRLDDDKKANLYDRANHFRRNNEYDKAMSIYELILQEDNEDAEAYWSLVLCKYGIEYIEDPRTQKRMVTCNRTQTTSIYADEDFKAAIKYASGNAKSIYESEAGIIDSLQRSILEIAQNEEPFDVFICYKETDNSGRRTQDSVLAQDLYYLLKQEGFKVFFSRVSLEDKLGSEYEPYIFAALKSSSVLVVLGTHPEHFNSVWVKNEWSRYLSFIKNGEQKILVPAFKNMDPYDLPDEFSHLQAQDMSKLGFMQDLVRGIKKIAGNEKRKGESQISSTINVENRSETALLKRAYLCIEDGDFERADELLEQVLNHNPELAKAYVGKLLVEEKIQSEQALGELDHPIHDDPNFKKAIRFSDEKYRGTLEGYNKILLDRVEAKKQEDEYDSLIRKQHSAKSESEYRVVAELFENMSGYRDADERVRVCNEKAEIAKEKAEIAKEKAKEKAQREKELQIKRNLEFEQFKRKFKRVAIASILSLITFLSGIYIYNNFYRPSGLYNRAEILLETRDYYQAQQLYSQINDFRDSASKLLWTKNPISGGVNHTAGVKTDGTVVVVGEHFQSKAIVDGWTDIVAVSIGPEYLAGIKKNGTAVAVALDDDTPLDLSSWNDVIDITTGHRGIVGLRSDGSVIIEGGFSSDTKTSVSAWRGIIGIQTNGNAVRGLTRAGRVEEAAGTLFSSLNVGSLDDLMSISGTDNFLFGLKKNGTVYRVRIERYDSNTSLYDGYREWRNIVAISAGAEHIVGLNENGTVVAVGVNNYGQLEVSDWTDIVAISAGTHHTIGLRRDGTVLSVGGVDSGLLDTSDWSNVGLVN